jgi:hypothetical protein
MSFIGGDWLSVKDGDPAAYQLFTRHYSFHQYKDNRRLVGRNRHLIAGPGDKMVLLTEDYKALFVWRKFIDDSGQVGVNCSVFRNEGPILSSELIKQADELAWNRWPGERLYTYVDGSQVHGDGCCFKKAGWKKLKYKTKSGKIILEIFPA